jgi:hypothetical protein
MSLLDSLAALQGRVKGTRDAAYQGVLGPLLEQQKAREEERQRQQKLGDNTAEGIGLAKQLNRSGMFGDPNAQQAVGLMLDPGSRALGVEQARKLLDPAAVQALAAGKQGMEFAANQDQRAQTSLDLDQQRTQAYIGNMTYDNAVKASAAMLAGSQASIKNESELRGEFQKMPVVVKAGQAISSWTQLQKALAQDNPVALQSAIVALTQVQEPGLAVRNDDRIAYTGNNSVIENLTMAFNKAVSGEGLTPGIKQKMLALGTQLAGVSATNYLRAADEYRQIAVRTPGARPDLVTTGTGIDEEAAAFLSAVTSEPRRGPGGR